MNKKILKNFDTYDNFLLRLEPKDRKSLLSLKMMYAIHMEYHASKIIFVIKQLLRFILKVIAIPFIKIEINAIEKRSENIILANSKIEKDISKRLNISLVTIRSRFSFNLNSILIYKKLYHIILLLQRDKDLKKRYTLSLFHRIVDYLLVYHTIEVKDIRLLLVENDRDPRSLALIHRLKESSIKTIKYDNWLIDPINHNDVYCEYYFYPSFYHKNIIASFASNTKLKYLEGGFFDWDRLINYKQKPRKRVIYFTQFGIEMSQHKQYIHDISEILKSLDDEYQFIIKIHPRENISKYSTVIEEIYPVEFISICDDVYQLISEAEFCFSVFSTISLEAKHIIANSYFINYDYENFEIVDYSSIKLDLIKNKRYLKKVLTKKINPINQKLFIEKNNSTFPDTLKRMERILTNDAD